MVRIPDENALEGIRDEFPHVGEGSETPVLKEQDGVEHLVAARLIRFPRDLVQIEAAMIAPKTTNPLPTRQVLCRMHSRWARHSTISGARIRQPDSA